MIVTATPSTKPIILNDWIKEGVHINAIGADAPGKQELDEAVIPMAKVVVDNIVQCIERGEIQTAIRRAYSKRMECTQSFPTSYYHANREERTPRK